MAEFVPEDLAVVIPTRDRWKILRWTLDALAAQTVSGFAVVVVVDGTDQTPIEARQARLIVKEHAGPAAARNAGVRESDGSLVLFLGDDTIPQKDFVERHLERHNAAPDQNVAILGRIAWHPEVSRDRVLSWLEWSGTQFDYDRIDGGEAGWGRFYSSNVSVKRDFFLDAGAFDEDFPNAAYEDLDCGWRLNDRGMQLLYEPRALALHHHLYDMDALGRRFAAVALGERIMIKKHPDFVPYFHDRVRAAIHRPRVSRVWPQIVDRIPRTAGPLRRFAERRANDWYYQQVAGSFLAAWERADARGL